MINNIKGITLIALVITITISLILSSITIGAISGDHGLIERAGKAKNEAAAAEEREIIENVIVESTNKLGDIPIDTLKENISNKISDISIDNSVEGYPLIFTTTTTNRAYEIDELGNLKDEMELLKDAILRSWKTDEGLNTEHLDLNELKNNIGLHSTMFTYNSAQEFPLRITSKKTNKHYEIDDNGNLKEI